MKRILLLSFVLCLSIESFSSVRHLSGPYSLSIVTDGPFEELSTLFSVYTEKIGSVASEEEYNTVKEEFNQALSELNEKYPEYEPSASELKEIESLFSVYEEERSTTCERLEISDEGGSGDDEEMNLYDESTVESIIQSYSNITDPIAKATAVVNGFADKFEETDDFMSLLILNSTMEAVMTRMEVFEDPVVNRAFEDESSELAQSINRLQTNVTNAISRISGESSDGEGDGEEEPEQEFESTDDINWSETGFTSVDEAGETIPLEGDSEDVEIEQEFESTDDINWSENGFTSVDEAGETMPLEGDSEGVEVNQEFESSDDNGWSTDGFKPIQESGDTSSDE